jgi:aspartate racemase
MATNGTYHAAVYNDLLRQWGYDAIVPDQTFQNDVIHRMIYDPEFGIKANSSRTTSQVKRLRDKAINYFRERKADAIIVGCTELSLVLTEKVAGQMLLVDALKALAGALIREAVSPGRTENNETAHKVRNKIVVNMQE